MAYKVVTQPRAERDIAEAFAYIGGSGASEAAAKWYRNIKAEIDALSEFPGRFSIAPESDRLGMELRQFHFGKRTGTYRVVYRIVETLQEVHVLTVRHGSRRPLEIRDLL